MSKSVELLEQIGKEASRQRVHVVQLIHQRLYDEAAVVINELAATKQMMEDLLRRKEKPTQTEKPKRRKSRKGHKNISASKVTSIKEIHSAILNVLNRSGHRLSPVDIYRQVKEDLKDILTAEDLAPYKTKSITRLHGRIYSCRPFLTQKGWIVTSGKGISTLWAITEQGRSRIEQEQGKTVSTIQFG